MDVLSSAMADWDPRDTAPAFNSSNEEDGEEDFEEGEPTPRTARWHGNSPYDTPPPHFQQRQDPNQAPFSALLQYQQLEQDNYHAVTAAALLSDALTFPSAASAQTQQEDYLLPSFPFGGEPHMHATSTQQEARGGLDDEGDDDRKPAAHGEADRPPYRKHHSLSKDPFHPSSSESIEEPPPAPDSYINPSLSFDDDNDDGRNQEGHFELPGWRAADDPALQNHPHYTPLYPSFAPPLAFTLGDRFPNFPVEQGSPHAHAVASRAPRRKRGPPRRRNASREELDAAGTERARAAVVTWYERFNELVEYCEVHGDCNVPQKYPPNPQLGIVRLRKFACVQRAQIAT